MNLKTGEILSFEGIQSFSFSSDGVFLAMQRYPPKAPAAPSAGRGQDNSGEAAEKLGTTLIVRKLSNQSDTTFGNVSQSVWQDTENSHLLAITISADGKTGNGIHLFDAETGVLRVLDSSSSIYKGLSWREDAADLSVFRTQDDEGREGATHLLLAWTGIGQNERQFLYDPTKDPKFPEDKRTVSFRPLSWSDNGKILFFGIAKWENKALPDKKSEEKPETKTSENEAEGEDEAAGKTPTEEPSTVEIWHWTDVFVMPWQKEHARQDRQRNMLSAWHLEDGKFVQLAKDPINEQVTLIQHSNLAYVAEWSKYAMERSIGRSGADLYLLEVTSGIRTMLIENINDWYVESDPSGKYLLFLQDKHYWTVDLDTREIVNITKNAPVSFIDSESDLTLKIFPDRLQKPPFGVAGWTKTDASVLLYDKYDVWKVAPDGSKVERLTDGSAEQVRHRLIILDEAAGSRRWRGFGSIKEEGIDLNKPVYLTVYGEWTKKSGFARLEPGGRCKEPRLGG